MENFELINIAINKVFQEAKSMDAAAFKGQSVLEALLEEEMKRFAVLAAEFNGEADCRKTPEKQILRQKVRCKNCEERNRLVQDFETKAVHKLSCLKQQHESTEALKEILCSKRNLRIRHRGLLA